MFYGLPAHATRTTHVSAPLFSFDPYERFFNSLFNILPLQQTWSSSPRPHVTTARGRRGSSAVGCSITRLENAVSHEWGHGPACLTPKPQPLIATRARKAMPGLSQSFLLALCISPGNVCRHIAFPSRQTENAPGPWVHDKMGHTPPFLFCAGIKYHQGERR